MSIGLGVALQRLKQVRSIYSVAGKIPGFTADFIRNKYPGYASLSSAITHARAGNATMTDGYGPELVVNGGFDSDSDWTKGTGWSIADGVATANTTLKTHSLKSVDPYQGANGKTYIVTATFTMLATPNANAGVRINIGGVGENVFIESERSLQAGQTYTISGFGTPTDVSGDFYVEVGSTAHYPMNYTIDNVSVREMPVIKWAPHNLLTYSEDPSSSLTSTNDASWTSNNTLTATAQSGNQTPYARVLQTFTQKGTYVFAVETTSTTVQYLTLQTQIFDANANGVSVFDIQSGSVNTEASQHTATITATSSGFLCAIEFELDGTDLNGYLTMGLSEVSGIHRIIDPDGTESVTVTRLRSYRSDLGGMVDNPDRGDSYVPTVAVASGDSIVVDGGFDDATNWTLGTGWSISGSKLVGSNVGGTAYAQQTLNTTSGAYVVTFDVTDYTSGNLDVFLGGVTSAVISITGAGSYSVVITGVGTFTNTTLRLSAGNANFTGSVDNLVVKKSLVDPSAARYLPRIGHHVYNGNAWVNEGVLAESESRVNLWLYSNDPTDASWSFANDVTRPTSASLSGPDGQTSGYSLIPTTAGSSHYVAQSFSLTSGNDYTLSFYLKENGYRYAQIIIGGAYSADDYANFDLQDGVIGDVSTTATATIQDVGNGWFRCSCTFPADATAAGNSGIGFIESLTDGRVPTFSGDGTSGVGVYGAQLEEASTPSSLIPTSGQQGTREAESFTIPSANLPWPTPQSITGNVYSGTDPVNITGAHTFTPTIANDGSTKVVRVKWTQTLNSGTRTRMRFRNAANSADVLIRYYNGSGTFEEIIVTSTGLLWLQIENAVDVDISGITLEEINPLSICIGMEGRVTFADTDVGTEATFLRWLSNNENLIINSLQTGGSRTGLIQFRQESNNVNDSVFTSTTYFSPDILVPFNMASRHGSTFVNGAESGVAFTANTTPVSLADLSATDLNLAHKYMGTISEFRVWDKDLGDAGLVEATNPSLEPSLSLTFEGTGTNSFVVNNWSE